MSNYIYAEVVFSYFYSAQPLRFKEFPPLDSFSNGVLYFYAPLLMGFSFGSHILAIPMSIYFLTLSVMGIHAFSTVQDYNVDKKIGDKTFSTVFGKRTAAFFALITFLATYFFSNIQTIYIRYYLLFLSSLSLIIFAYPNEKIASFFFKLIFLGFATIAIVYLIGL